MEKQIRRFKVNFDFDWTYGVELKKLKSDIEELEKLGVTEIEIEAEDNWGAPSVTIEAFTKRLETDEEFKERLDKEKKIKEHLVLIFGNILTHTELQELERLKAKYDTKKK